MIQKIMEKTRLLCISSFGSDQIVLWNLKIVDYFWKVSTISRDGMTIYRDLSIRESQHANTSQTLLLLSKWMPRQREDKLLHFRYKTLYGCDIFFTENHNYQIIIALFHQFWEHCDGSKNINLVTWPSIVLFTTLFQYRSYLIIY